MFERWAQKLLTTANIQLNGTHPSDPHIRRPRVFRRAFLWGSLGLGDAYVDGDWECEQLDEFFHKILSVGMDYKVNTYVDTLDGLRNRLFNLQTVQRALHVAERHYDLGNELYEHMLGDSMAYSSGYYKTGAQDLTGSQYAKFDIICKKMSFKPGMRVLEIGCGWGSFAAYAAKEYGVEVLGVTVSKEQLAYAWTRCANLPVSFYFGDYRTIPSSHEGTFDRVVSIEMIEAVGQKNFRTYMEVAARMLKANGHFLIQAIVGSGTPDVWIATHIFPNGTLPSHEQLEEAMRGIFSLKDEEYFGGDYDTTLLLWDKNFRNAWPRIKAIKNKEGVPLYDERFYRMWRYYLMSCAGAFRAGKKVGQLHLIKT